MILVLAVVRRLWNLILRLILRHMQLTDSNEELNAQLKEANERILNFETELAGRKDNETDRTLSELRKKLEQAEEQLRNVRNLELTISIIRTVPRV